MGIGKLRAMPTIMALAGLSAAMIFAHAIGADTTTHAMSMANTRCYCECEHDGTMCAMKFCELPKYEHKEWAASCHKKMTAEARASKPANPAPTEKRSHGVYAAQR